MTKEEVKKILDQQLELLAEASKEEKRCEVMVLYAHAITELAAIRLSCFRID